MAKRDREEGMGKEHGEVDRNRESGIEETFDRDVSDVESLDRDLDVDVDVDRGQSEGGSEQGRSTTRKK